MIDPRPPFIVDATACKALSISALKCNLAKHAEYNPSIVSTGTKSELIARLQTILETRKLDLLVREMIWGDE